jgi:hypothetical protein
MSSAEFTAIQARLEMNKKAANLSTAIRKSEKTEADIHSGILDECRRRGWIAFHGSMAHRTKRTEGEPDFIILADKRILLVECKRPGGKLSPEQNAIKFWAEKLGHKIHVVYSHADFIKVIHEKD